MFYISDDDETVSETESDVDNINDDINFLGDTYEDIFDNNNLGLFLKYFICLDNDIIKSIISVPEYNNKDIKSDEIYEGKICSECNKGYINTTYCCKLRNEEYYFCDDKCWSLWINNENNLN